MPLNPERVGSRELLEQPPGALGQVRYGPGELAFEQVPVDEAHEDRAAVVAVHDLAESDPRAGLVGPRLLREEEIDVALRGRAGNGFRRRRERPFACPELEQRLRARLSHGDGELRALLGERLVDKDEDALTGLQPAGCDQVCDPAWMLLLGHLVHPARTLSHTVKRLNVEANSTWEGCRAWGNWGNEACRLGDLRRRVGGA